ncbi:SemiSWEET transporter [Permianibacter aggregans]|uniref:MtN3 and saliva related transmembrane protein n=1 Tax=Permianibacter aggregans TaxID=1510150 RepID=A0A4R6UYP3_9GAMM|nr:SemiSWEET transporter [Permianibacter aggregans]TDQ51103.1 MtN3 and saliva related transmembrane protein [Permianibacter aggregans]
MDGDFIGYLAACCTTFSFLPQVFRAWQTRDTKAISLSMYLVFVTGVALWLVYGVLIGNWPMMVANGLTLTLAGSVLVMKLRYG